MPDTYAVTPPAHGWVRSERAAWFTHSLAVAAALLAVVLALQWMSGAFQSERGLYSDEAAHVLNGMLLRDYLREGLGQNPMDFARDYYRQYPKIAPFMWPPLFHTVLGVTLVAGFPAPATALVLLALCAAWIAWRLYLIGLQLSSRPIAVGTVAVLLTTPAVVGLATAVMIDIVIAAFALEAAYWLGRFAHSGRTRDAALFGFMTACACASKGNGISAVIAPAVLLAVSGRYRLLRRPGLYVAAVIVLVLAVPPLYVAWVLDSALGDFGPITWAMLADRWSFYSSYVVQQLGALPMVLALVGMGAALTPRGWASDQARAIALGLLAMTGGAFLFHLFNPHLLSDERYITLALPPMLGLAGLGTTVMSRALGPRLHWASQAAIVLAVAITHGATHPPLVAQAPLGYRDALHFLHDRHALAGQRVLVVSNEQGEGAGVVEAAVLAARPGPMILRGSKLLGSDDWMGRGFHLRYDSEAALLADLEAMHVNYVLLDRSAEARSQGYWSQIDALLTTRPDRFEQILAPQVDAVHGPLRPLVLYRVKFAAPGPPKAIDFSNTPHATP